MKELVTIESKVNFCKRNVWNFNDVEQHWKDIFESLIDVESKIKEDEDIEVFVSIIQKFNEYLHYINVQEPKLIGYTRYWIHSLELKWNIRDKYNLSDSIIMKDNHISFFLKETNMFEEDGHFFFSKEEYDYFLHQTNV